MLASHLQKPNVSCEHRVQLIFLFEEGSPDILQFAVMLLESLMNKQK